MFLVTAFVISYINIGHLSFELTLSIVDGLGRCLFEILLLLLMISAVGLFFLYKLDFIEL